ncbi:MAG TPA: NADP-dependent glyceraldehyde-3-phosphate dehydrogenase [Firmicutes bacterium]|nr:NADP-dependent glyceraldehyde-3-phosphate dehydrogenase [Bacillota bacterium]
MLSHKVISITSPLDNTEIGEVKAMSQNEVDHAITQSKIVLKVWKNTSLFERGQYLNKAADLLFKYRDELIELLIKEVGKDRKSAQSEVLRTVDFIRYTIETAKTMYGQAIPADTVEGVKKGKIAITTREPMGVVLAISPFNYPVNLAVSKIAPALMGGNTVVFKPATQGSLCGSLLTKIFNEAGLPKDVLTLVTGKGSEIGDYIITHPDINFINFTGSTQIGRHIAKQVEMVPLLMELGGKDAAIVLEDADLELAAKQIVSGAFSYSGQRCTAIKRVLVLDHIADELVFKMVEHMKDLKVGNPLEQDVVDVVPLIDQASANFVHGLIDDANKLGATTIYGGQRIDNLIYPTLLDHVTTHMRVAWEEPFGPVLPIIRVKSIEEAIDMANASEYGLQSSIFTTNINSAFELANKLEVGTVQINNRTERGPDHLPFLGVKNSGIGVQGISYSIESMTRIKSTVINL